MPFGLVNGFNLLIILILVASEESNLILVSSKPLLTPRLPYLALNRLNPLVLHVFKNEVGKSLMIFRRKDFDPTLVYYKVGNRFPVSRVAVNLRISYLLYTGVRCSRVCIDTRDPWSSAATTSTPTVLLLFRLLLNLTSFFI